MAERGNERPLLVGGERLRGKGNRPRRRPGDEKAHPYTIEEVKARLCPQAETLAVGVSNLPEALRGEHVIFEATLEPNYLANSYFPENTLATEGLYVVGTRQTAAPHKTKDKVKEDVATKTLLVAGRQESIVRFATKIADSESPAVDWDEVREFHDLSLPTASRILRSVPEELGAGELVTWEAVLHPIGQEGTQRNTWIDAGFEKFVRIVRALGGDVDVAYRRGVDGLTFVPALLHKEGALSATRFNLLRSLQPMPKLRSFPSFGLRSAKSKKVPAPTAIPATAVTAERVAIFDGGVPDALPHFAPFVRQHHLTSEPPDVEGLAHGTGVTSAFLFGHISVGQALAQPLAYVDHYRVYPPPQNPTFDENLYWVLDRIEEVAKQRKHRFINLSFAPDIVINDRHEPHRWTSTLDRLTRDYGTTFICAAGNNGREDRKSGQNRVLVPSDMVNGVTVGACDASLTSKIRRAPYSPMGPGRPGQRVQPIGVLFGGNLKEDPFRMIGPAGELAEQEGTSFAAPLATRSAVDLSAALPPSGHASTHVRTFFAHFATPTVRHRLKELGYGRLRERFDEVWTCAPNECVVLYEEKLSRDETVAMAIPVPPGIPDDSEVHVRWTISYLSDTDAKDAFEYTLDGLEITFRPHARRVSIKDLNRTKDKTIGTFDLDRQAEEIAALRETTLIEVGDVPVPGPGWRALKGESRQREDGKWETLIRGDVKLPAGDLLHPRVDVHYLRRSRGQLVSDNVEPLAVSMLVSLHAPVGVPLYDLVRSEYPVLVAAPLAVASAVVRTS